MLDRIYRRFISAIDRGSLPPGLQKALWRGWYQILTLGWRDRAWTFMNYGWLPEDASRSFALEPADETDRCFIGLYHHLAGKLDLAGRQVLEVGSGRGGGSSYLARYHAPAAVTGVDFSGMAVRLSRRLHAGTQCLRFAEGDAEALPFADASFDAVINVESSHCYGDMAAFLGEVERVLRPGGRFAWADIRGGGMMDATRRAFAGSGLRPLVEEDITAGVLRAMDATHERKAEAIGRLLLGKALVREFAATQDSALYASLKHGGTRYLCKVFEKASAGIP